MKSAKGIRGNLIRDRAAIVVVTTVMARRANAAAAAPVPAGVPMRAARKGRATVAQPAETGSGPESPAVTSFIAIGGNLGDAKATAAQAIKNIGALPHTTLLRQSSLYRTAPVDSTGPDYINAVVEISTRLAPHALLAQLQALENAAGRDRPFRNAPRTLDLDILLYADQMLNTATLAVPHPRMMQRAFVLTPLAEIAPERVSARQLMAVRDQPICRIAAATPAET